MLEAKVIVELPGIAEAINALADAIRESKAAPEKAKKAKVEKPVTAAKETEEATQAAESVPQMTPVEIPEPEPPLVEVPKEEPAPVKVYTFNQISKAGAKLCADASKMDQLVRLLNEKYGVPALTKIPEDRFPELAEDLKALGAVFEEE